MSVWRVVAACVLAMVAAWAGTRLYTTRHVSLAMRADRGVPVPAGEASEPTFSDLGTAGGLAAPVKIPEMLPAFTLTDRHGRATSIESWPGKSLIINFWATWCAPCQREIPLLKSVAAAWSGRDFQVVGIAVDYPDKVESFARQFGISYPLLVGEQDALDAAAALGVESPAFPFTVFTDHGGRVVALFVGELHPPQASLILSVVQQVNQGRVDLAVAKHLIATGLEKLQTQRAG